MDIKPILGVLTNQYVTIHHPFGYLCGILEFEFDEYRVSTEHGVVHFKATDIHYIDKNYDIYLKNKT